MLDEIDDLLPLSKRLNVWDLFGNAVGIISESNETKVMRGRIIFGGINKGFPDQFLQASYVFITLEPEHLLFNMFHFLS